MFHRSRSSNMCSNDRILLRRTDKVVLSMLLPIQLSCLIMKRCSSRGSSWSTIAGSSPWRGSTRAESRESNAIHATSENPVAKRSFPFWVTAKYNTCNDETLNAVCCCKYSRCGSRRAPLRHLTLWKQLERGPIIFAKLISTFGSFHRWISPTKRTRARNEATFP